MARTKVTPKKEREGRRVLQTPEEQKRISKKGRRSPLLYTTPPQPRKPSPMREVEKMVEEAVRQVEEARWLEEVGRSLLLLPTQQLAQMAVEAGPSASGEEPAVEEALPYCGRQSPPEGVPHSRKGQEAQKVPAWHSCPPRDLAVWKEHSAPDLETPLLMASPWDSPSFGPKPICTSRGVPLYACRRLQKHFGVSHGRHQLLHHTCEKGDNYAQGHSVSLPHLGRASKILRGSSKQANLLFLGCVGFSLLFVFSSGTGKGI